MGQAIDSIIDRVLEAEGGYVDNPNDKGGKTNFGITEAVARAAGYTFDMKDMPQSFARSIYLDQYVVKPGFDKVLMISPEIAAELVDTGVNMGPRVAAMLLQRALNLFNKHGEVYGALKVDGAIGSASLNALNAYIANRKANAVPVLIKVLNILQGFRYIELAEGNPSQKEFIFGWINARIQNW